MVVVALHAFHPFAGKPGGVGFIEQVCIRHLARNEKAHLIGPIKEARVFHFLMLSRPVEAHLLGHADIVLHRLIGWRRQSALRPITLIEHHLEINRTAV